MNPAYIDSLRRHAKRVRHVSRYFNAVSVDIETRDLEAACGLEFVRSADLVASFRRLPGGPPAAPPEAHPARAPGAERALEYGESYEQLNQLGLIDHLESGVNGSGIATGGDPVLIALLDTGFRLDHPALAHVSVEAQYDFLNGDSVTANEAGDPAGQDTHGTRVLGVLAGYAEGDLIGPAWGARFLLAKTEIESAEIPIEEDHWVAGIEWADSAGADIVSSSLGYILWYEAGDLDGNTALCTRAADIAASHGVVVVNSAGNQGISGLVTPADGDSVLAIGAVDRYGFVAAFSSRGPTADGRIKPDFAAMGVGVRSVADAAGYGSYNGTSFAAPLVAGLCAVLLELHPHWSPMALRDTLRATASRSAAPDNAYGWGIPNAALAVRPPAVAASVRAFPNPFSVSTSISVSVNSPETVTIRVYDCRGALVRTLAGGESVRSSLTVAWDGTNDRGERAAGGIYFIAVSSAASLWTVKTVLLR